jgi:hypothetical protein
MSFRVLIKVEAILNPPTRIAADVVWFWGAEDEDASIFVFLLPSDVITARIVSRAVD